MVVIGVLLSLYSSIPWVKSTDFDIYKKGQDKEIWLLEGRITSLEERLRALELAHGKLEQRFNDLPTTKQEK